MNISPKEITVRKLTEGYTDNEEGGVRGYSGRLDIRPPYQREFVYGEKQRNAVIDTVMKGFPLNVMYWATREERDQERPSHKAVEGRQGTERQGDVQDPSWQADAVGTDFRLPGLESRHNESRSEEV